VECHFCRLFYGDSFFFFFNAFHKFFCIGILRSHDIRNAQIGKNNRSNWEEVIHLSAHEWLVVSDSVAIFIVLHEENMGNI
jgi:hypothetical protein